MAVIGVSMVAVVMRCFGWAVGGVEHVGGYAAGDRARLESQGL